MANIERPLSNLNCWIHHRKNRLLTLRENLGIKEHASGIVTCTGRR